MQESRARSTHIMRGWIEKTFNFSTISLFYNHLISYMLCCNPPPPWSWSSSSRINNMLKGDRHQLSPRWEDQQCRRACRPLWPFCFSVKIISCFETFLALLGQLWDLCSHSASQWKWSAEYGLNKVWSFQHLSFSFRIVGSIMFWKVFWAYQL